MGETKALVNGTLEVENTNKQHAATAAIAFNNRLVRDDANGDDMIAFPFLLLVSQKTLVFQLSIYPIVDASRTTLLSVFLS